MKPEDASRNDHELHYLEMQGVGAEVKDLGCWQKLAGSAQELNMHGSIEAGVLVSLLEAASQPQAQPWAIAIPVAQEAMRTNLNALGDSVVSFAVLALAASPDSSCLAWGRKCRNRLFGRG